MIILGIDPGTAIIGYGIIKTQNNKIHYIDHGCIYTQKENSDQERLLTINKELKKIIKKYKPDCLSVEKLFFFKNAKTVISVSQAKGVILLTAHKEKLPIFEYTPLQVKMAITGYGKATKKQIQKTVKMVLGLKEIPSPDDAADAISVAICHANSIPLQKVLTRKFKKL